MSRSFVPTAVVVAAACAVAAPGAAAHTRATCTLDRGQAHCVGTIADRTVALATEPGSLTIDGTRGRLELSAWPLVPVLDHEELVATADLACRRTLGAARCSGPGFAADDPVWIQTSGNALGGSAIVSLEDRDGSPDARSACGAHRTRLSASRTR